MKRKLLPVSVSVIWVVAWAIVAICLWGKGDPPPPNAIGDFLSGVFSPLALFWLILGYFQQGEELRNSSRALDLQAAELRNSVEQQKSLVEVTKQELEVLRAQIQRERELELKRAQPEFRMKLGSSSGLIGSGGSMNVRVENHGHTVKQVRIEGDGLRIIPDGFLVFDSGHTDLITVIPERKRANDFEIRITFIDGLSNKAGVLIQCRNDGHGNYIFSNSEPI